MAYVRELTRPAVLGWALFDVANTIFSLGIISLYFSLWIREMVGPRDADAAWGVILAVSYGIVFVLSPLLGAMTDRARRRMPFLITSTALCVLCTLPLARVNLLFSALCFVLANIAYQAGVQVYDSLLPDVSSEQNRGKISGLGVATGYVGAGVVMGIGLIVGAEHKTTLFPIIAVLFLGFALPCFLLVRERGNPHPRPVFALRAVHNSARETIRAVRHTKEHPGLLRFLVGRLIYTDAINTAMAVMALYSINIARANGWTAAESEQRAQIVLMFGLVFAMAGGLFWGALSDRLGPRRVLAMVLNCWIVVFSCAAAIGMLRLSMEVFYVAAAMAGFAQGGVFAADRPFLLRLTPPGRVGEFVGLYGMVGRFAAIAGPGVWAMILLITTRMGLDPLTGQSLAMLVLLVQIVISTRVLRRVNDAPRRWVYTSPLTEHAPVPPLSAPSGAAHEPIREQP
jgi:UMF1 family MFS transporter